MGDRVPFVVTLHIVGIALVASLSVTLAGAAVLMLLRRAALAVQMGVLVAIAATTVVASMLAVANWMFLSQHDLTVGIYVALIAGFVSIVFSVLLGVVVSRNFRRLILATRRMGEGSAVRRLADGSSAEFRNLALELDITSARLEESRQHERQLQESRRALIAGISHDLRTPLAGIRAMSEALEDGMVDDQQQYLRQMRVKVEQLGGMVDDLFQLSRIDSGLLNLDLSDVSLYDLVSDAVADLGILAAGRPISVDASSAEDLTVHADPRELSRAMSNLLNNAVQHTPPGTPVSVVAGRRADGRASVSVIDGGGGIPEGDLSRVFEAGWRGEPSRSAHSGANGGSGLGLAIVAGILKAHDGEVTVHNVPGGCRFDLILPTRVRKPQTVTVL
jgi:signal transduction histidine kinase